MAGKKIEFKPDQQGSSILSKLYLTPSQRKTILKWFLYGLSCVLALVIQDSVLGRARLLGGRVDLVPVGILLVCVLEGSHSGCAFALAGSLVFVFSGSAPDSFAVAFLTVYGTLAAMFRESYLRRGFSSAWLCAVAALGAYELSTFGMGLMFGLTHPGRLGAFLATVALGALVMPVVYPLLKWIGNIGGETWKE